MRPSRPPYLALLAATLLGAVTLLGIAAPTRTAVADTTGRLVAVDGGAVVPGEDRDLEAIRQEIRRREAGTYIAEILAERDSSLARWPDRGGAPVNVWIRPTADGVENWTPSHVAEVRAAFEEWNSVGLPLRFAFVDDSVTAEVHVNWIARFDEPISGRTRWARNDGWWITDGVITLAVHHHQGMLLDGDAVRAMALHEIGHLVGLDHTTNLGSVMARRVRVRGIAPVDKATAELLYAVPAGRIR